MALLIVPLVVKVHGGDMPAAAIAAPTAVVAAGAVAAGATMPGAAAAAMAGATSAKSEEAMALAAKAAADAASVKVENGVVKFYFASGKADLAGEGAAALKDIVDGVKNGKKAAISGYVDASGDPVKNAELAKQRAFAVRDLLKANGVAEDKIELKKPADITAGATSAAEARRVEVTLM